MNFNHRTRQGEPGIVACLGNTKATAAGPHSPRVLAPRATHPRPQPGPHGGSKWEDSGSPVVGAQQPTPGCPPRHDLAFPASPPPAGAAPTGPGSASGSHSRYPSSPSDPAAEGYFLETRPPRMGKVPHLTSNCKSGASALERGTCSGTHADSPSRPVHRDLPPFTGAWQRTAAL